MIQIEERRRLRQVRVVQVAAAVERLVEISRALVLQLLRHERADDAEANRRGEEATRGQVEEQTLRRRQRNIERAECRGRQRPRAVR